MTVFPFLKAPFPSPFYKVSLEYCGDFDFEFTTSSYVEVRNLRPFDLF